MYLLTFRRYFLHIHGQPVQELGLAQLDNGDEGTATSETSFIVYQSTRRNHAGELNLILGGGFPQISQKIAGTNPNN
jgi:hypothetical protein